MATESRTVALRLAVGTALAIGALITVEVV
jgi:hypothetical protein